MLYFAESHITVIGVDGKTFNGKTHFHYREDNSEIREITCYLIFHINK